MAFTTPCLKRMISEALKEKEAKTSQNHHCFSRRFNSPPLQGNGNVVINNFGQIRRVYRCAPHAKLEAVLEADHDLDKLTGIAS